MARLSETDRDQFKALTRSKWRQSPEEVSPAQVAPTLEARHRYCLWAAEAARFYKGTKPVRFVGTQWKL
jgi:hypothetical protein